MNKPAAGAGSCTFAKLLGVSYQVAFFRTVGVKASTLALPKPEKAALKPAGSPAATMRSGRSPR